MTLDYYNKNAAAYSQQTLSAEFDHQQNMLLQYLKPKAHILDLGCGSGRDSKAFIQQGYRVTAIDGSQELCKLASQYIGQEVICQRFQDLQETATYDGVWACASLLHLPSADLPEMIGRISDALKLGGCFYASFKYGDFQGWRDGRYFTDLTKESLKTLLIPLKQLKLIETAITSDVRLDRQEQKWLNIVIRKI